MNAMYGISSDWRVLGGVVALHAILVFGLLSVEPVAKAVGLQQPLMLSLLADKEPEVWHQPLKPLPVKPQVKPVQLPQSLPVLALREAASNPDVVPEPQQEPVPDPVIVPAAISSPVKTVAIATAAAPPLAPVVPPRFDADYLENPAPAYPTLSRRLGEFGSVLLRVYVSAEGAAAQVEIRQSSGYERLDKAARDTVQRWRFVPAKQGGQGVDAWVLVPISFSLRS